MNKKQKLQVKVKYNAHTKLISLNYSLKTLYRKTIKILQYLSTY